MVVRRYGRLPVLFWSQVFAYSRPMTLFRSYHVELGSSIRVPDRRHSRT